jgi:glutaredoxin-like protein NrdH
MLNFTHVPGKTPARIVLFALSTCGWCRKTKLLLDELGLGYDFVDVDLLDQTAGEEAKRDISRWNPRCSFPTLVIDGSRCIVGFDEENIRNLAAG